VSTTLAENFVTSTVGKFATGVNNIGDKFAIGVNNTSGKLPAVSMTPAANFLFCCCHWWQIMGTISDC
jgi:hypothetical protein